MRYIVYISRILFGAVFIFSGFVKAIDPLGSAYKFQDYFLAFGTEWMSFAALPMAILLSTLEFIIGMGVLFGIKMRWSAWGALLFMAFFTPLTLYIAITDPVPDCGCFGDAIIISNWETFYKNVVVLAAAIIVFLYRKQIKPPWSKTIDHALMILVTAGILLLSAYCLRNLPIIDFRPWKVGNDVEIGFFYIEDEFGEDLTDQYLSEPGYVFMVIAHDLHRTNTRAFHETITPLAREARQHGHLFIALTGSTVYAIEEFRHEHQTPYPFYLSDDIELKTIIRSNPGLVLIKDGVIKGKWAHRNIPTFEEIFR